MKDQIMAKNKTKNDTAAKTATKKSSTKVSSNPASAKKTPPQQTSQKPENEKETWLSIDEIETESPPEFRFRAGNDQDTIDLYAEALKFDTNGIKVKNDRHWPFPAIVVYLTVEGTYTPLSGIHRLHAAKQVGRKKVPVTIFEGTLEEAIWYGLGANRENGLRLRNGDLKHCIKKALGMRKESNRAIASHLGCSEAYVRKIVGEVRTSAQPNEKRTGKDGKQHPVQKAAHKKVASTEQEQVDADVVSENVEQQDNTVTQPEDTASETWQDRFREKFLTSTNEQEHLTSQIGFEILKHIYKELEHKPADRKSFIDNSSRYIRSTSEYKTEIKRIQNEKNSKVANQGAEHEQAVTD